MKRVIAIFVVIFALVLSLFFVWYNHSKQKNMELLMKNLVGEKYFLNDSFNSFLATPYISVDSVLLRHREDSAKLSDVVSFPCLVIYLPSVKEGICNSCIDYALNEAMNNLKNFSNNEHICIISVEFNPEIRERIYKKKCYFVDDGLLTVPQSNIPYYFVINQGGSVEYLFTPNSLFNEYTNIYLQQLKLKYKIL